MSKVGDRKNVLVAVHRHELLRPRPVPSIQLYAPVLSFHLHALLFDVRAHGGYAHVVDVVEVVAEVEFGEPEWDVEFGVIGCECGCAEECD